MKKNIYIKHCVNYVKVLKYIQIYKYFFINIFQMESYDLIRKSAEKGDLAIL